MPLSLRTSPQDPVVQDLLAYLTLIYSAKLFVIRRSLSTYLEPRAYCSTGVGGCTTGACGGTNKDCLSFVLEDNLTEKSLPLFHSYRAAGTGTASKIAVVTDVAAFNNVLQGVFKSDGEGVNGVLCDLEGAWRHQLDEIAQKVIAKHRVDDYIDNLYLPLLRYLIVILLIVQFIVLFRWVFVVFDWNLVEPMTYFIAYTAVWVGLVFHCYSVRGLSLETLLAERRRQVLYKRARIDGAAIDRQMKLLGGMEKLLARYGKV